MKNNHSSSAPDFLANSCGWAFAIALTLLAAFSIFQVFVYMQAHIHEEVAALSINQIIR
ncbi:MAG TPA: hypothetical protein VLL95_04705 [Phnomibacter sp.]|nr:hypothetical protein [Phnomibacter sp.]